MISLPILLVSLGCAMASSEFTPVHEWNSFRYHWNNESDKEHAIATGLYDQKNILLYDAAWSTDGKLWITTPRTHGANPASLSTVSEDGLLHPYPSPEWHVVGNCFGITNALKIVIDECDYLWIVDSGVIGNEVICPAQILKIDVKTDRVVLRHMIPEEVSKGGLLGTHAVKTEGDECQNVLLFAGDVRGSGYVIFNGTDSWRLDHECFKPDESFSKFKVDDSDVDVSYGPIAFTILPKEFADTDRGIMWSWSGRHVCGLPITELADSSESQENLPWYTSKYEFPTSATTGIISKEGIFFMAFFGNPKLNCMWMGNPLASENEHVLIGENQRFPVIVGMKTITDADGKERLYIITNNYLQFRAGKTNLDVVNAGIYVIDIGDLTNGTRCQAKSHSAPCKSWTERGFTPLGNHNGSDPES